MPSVCAPVYFVVGGIAGVVVVWWMDAYTVSKSSRVFSALEMEPWKKKKNILMQKRTDPDSEGCSFLTPGKDRVKLRLQMQCRAC